MTRPTNDPNPTNLIAGYVLDDLSPEEATYLRQALAEDPTRAEELRSFEEAFSLLSYDLPMVEPSAQLKAKILSAASRQAAASRQTTEAASSPQLSNEVPLAPRRQRQWRRWVPAISTSIAAVAVAALGLNQMQLGQQSGQTVALQQQLEATNAELARLRTDLQTSQATVAQLSNPNTQVQALIGSAPNPANSRLPTARLLVQPGAAEVTLVAHDLPKLSQDQVYRLWSVADASAPPTYCGQFRQNAEGTARWATPAPICTTQPSKFVITLDAPEDPITSAGPLVMQSAI